MSVADPILQARRLEGDFAFPWKSFAEFIRSRVEDPQLADRAFLVYVDEDCGIEREYRYAEFGERLERLVSFMREVLGLRRGDRVTTVLFNHDQTVLLYFAAWILGIAVVPINVEESAEKKRYILEHSEAAAVFCWKAYMKEVESLCTDLPALRTVIGVEDDGCEVGPIFNRSDRPTVNEETSLNDEALIVYTSGTTGPPKGVILTAANLLIDADAIAAWHGFGSADRLMCVLPIHHVNGTVCTLVTPLYFKGGTVLCRKFKTAGFWRNLARFRITCVSVVPTLLEFLMDADEDTSSQDLAGFGGFICGAGPLLRETAGRFELRFGFPIRHGYGLSETTCYSCFLPNDLSAAERRDWLTRHEFPSIGLPIKHNEMVILNDRGEKVIDGMRGEICIRGRTVCSGYFKRPDANEAAFRWGWFRSGDEGFVVRDAAGRPFFFISGRLKELIIRGGVNISPLEIDDVLKRHPAVKFAMAVPFENRYYGEEIAAYVVPRDGAVVPSEDALLEYCRTRLSFAKRPKVILFGHDVPYTATGKPKRLELKARLADRLSSYREVQFKEKTLPIS
ncbi:MAG: acyl--CoA ligase [Nitrospirae bacterium]|nr:MAG: acyl--CoA ligase [Nitrospirota bacterium]